jgi:glycyl-tRNA synthetase beta chain
MTELLLELFSEEIPAKMQTKAASQMLEILTKEIENLGLSCNKTEFFVTPRRIALYFEGLPKLLPEKIIERKGPKIDAPEAAIQGFLKSVGLKINELSIIDGCYYAKKLEKERPLAEALKAIIEQMLVSFTWPKSMRLGGGRNRWVRPLRNILCLFDGNILPIEFFNLVANDYSFGHRFMAPNQHKITSFADYQNKMKQSFVILSSEERKEIIKTKATEIATKLGLKVVLDNNLLEEVAGLVEYPNVLCGKIDSKFTKLPKEVLVSSMKTHQRYFYLEDDKGDIAPYFVFAANVKYDHDDIIIQGNEKVLGARLADAQFFWELDLKQPSSGNLAKLAKMTFHHKLGSMFDKTNRIIELAEFIANSLNYPDIIKVKKAALLAKTDLVSEMVGEFPELQGIMGKYYANQSGEERDVAIAIAEHYRPIDTNDQGDISYLGAIIAIADKLDTIIGLWIVGEKPTSSKDPFALRRAALGVIKLLRHHKMSLSLSKIFVKAISQYNVQDSGALEEVISFFSERLKYYLKGENFRHDLILAVGNNDDIYNSIENLKSLSEFIKEPKAQDLLIAVKRILNIIETSKEQIGYEVEQSLLSAPEENLYKVYNNIKEANQCEDLLPLVPLISEFFDKVMVNDPNLQLRKNRLNLLNNIARLSNKIADFSKIEG